MAPFDIPQITHDMMLRFMEVNFTALVDGSARMPSAVGTDAKPIFTEDHETKPGAPVSAKTPQQDKAMWEGEPLVENFGITPQLNGFFFSELAYYNAGSAAIVLVIVFLIIGSVVWCRHRRKRVRLGSQTLAEESIPLTSTRQEDIDDGEVERMRKAKGKHKATSREESSPLNGRAKGVQETQRIFDVGDSDEEDYKRN
jgi:carboxypeptidase D